MNLSDRTHRIAGVPPAMSAKREKERSHLSQISFAPAARCGRDARDPPYVKMRAIPNGALSFNQINRGLK
jgi:hypothetical protein